MLEGSEPKPLAFVIMPFAAEFDSIYQDLILPTLVDAGYEVQRADTVWDQQNIMRTVIQKIATADLIVAELTGANANVFYELGIAHGLRQPVILISQGVEGIPFDLRSYNTISYGTHFSEAQKLQTALGEVARRHIEGTVNFENPVTDFAPATSLPPQASKDTVVQSVGVEENEPPPSEDQEPAEELGVLDFQNESETSMVRIAEIQEEITALANDFAERLNVRGEEAIEISQSSAPGSTARMLKIIRDMASDINAFSDSIDERLPEFHDAWEAFEDNFTILLARTEIQSLEDREAAVDTLSQLEALREGVSQALSGAGNIRQQFQVMRGISQTLNVAVRRFERAFDNLTDEFSTAESIAVRVIALLDQKVPNIVITQPSDGDTISDSVRVIGSGRAYEGHINLRVWDAAGTVVAEGTALGGVAPEIRPFEAELSFSQQPQQPRGAVEAYAMSATGSEIDSVTVPIIFPTEVLDSRP